MRNRRLLCWYGYVWISKIKGIKNKKGETYAVEISGRIESE